MCDVVEQQTKPEGVSLEGDNLTASPHTVQPNRDNTVVDASDKTGPGDTSPDLAPDPSTTKFARLTFWNTKTKVVPVRYHGLHAVLDRLGRAEHPETWGKLAGWHLMPFLDRGAKGFGQPRLVREKGEAKLEYHALDSAFSHDELRACARAYREVQRKLSRALQRGELDAYALHPKTGRIERITTRGVWATQWIKIFYTGILPIEHNGRDELCRIIVRRGALTRWMKVLAERRLVNASRDLLHKIRDCLDQSAKAGGYHLPRAETLKLVKDACRYGGLSCSEGEFRAQIWNELEFRQTAGAPSTEDRAAFGDNKKQLKADVEAIVRASRHMNASATVVTTGSSPITSR